MRVLKSCAPGVRLIVGLGVLVLIGGCYASLPKFGIGGRYLEGKREISRPKGNLDQAIASLESVVTEDPTYRDSLTLLGRAYYLKGRYQDAKMIFQRAVAVNRNDEIAWVGLGMAQMRTGEDEKGLQSIRGGLTLLSKAMADGYRGFENWDPNNAVRTRLRRAALLATEGNEKEKLLDSLEGLVAAIDREEFAQGRDKVMEKAIESTP